MMSMVAAIALSILPFATLWCWGRLFEATSASKLNRVSSIPLASVNDSGVRLDLARLAIGPRGTNMVSGLHSHFDHIFPGPLFVLREGVVHG